MSKSRRRVFATLSILVLTLLSLLNACNLKTQQGADDENAVLTGAAQTIQANDLKLTIQAQQVLLTSQAQTLEAPLATPTIQPQQPLPETTLTQQPPDSNPLPTLTWTPVGQPRITANIETNCRTGPGAGYPRVGYLAVGQESTVHGRNSNDTWWYIANPLKPGEYCWVWGETMVVTGELTTLAVLTPAPLPVTAFQASFANAHNCGGVGTLAFWVKNSGEKTFRSSSITIKDMSSNEYISGPETSNAPFLTSGTSCGGGQDSLGPGETAYVSKGMGIWLPSGTQTRAIITLCTSSDQGGDCVDVIVNFEFP